MTISTAVKWAVSSMTGAPTLNGTAGSLIAVLDAFLVNGFGTKAVDSAQVTDGICRIAITGASAALDHSVIQLAGITGGGATLNGLQRVKTATASYVEFACDLPDGPLTGTITFKIAPLGWVKVFSKTNVAVYRSADVRGTGCFLRVDDTGALVARVHGYEQMSSVDDGVGMFPVPAQLAGGGFWPKSNTAGGATRNWCISGDARGFKLHVSTNSASGNSGSVYSFGDEQSLRSSDPYACMLHCALSDTSASATVSASTSGLEYIQATPADGCFMPRSYLTIGSSIAVKHGVNAAWQTNGAAGAVSTHLSTQYPNGPGNALLLRQKALVEPSGHWRANVRGLFFPLQACHSSFNHLDVVDGEGDAVGKKLLALKCGSPAGASSQGVVFVAITGEW